MKNRLLLVIVVLALAACSVPTVTVAPQTSQPTPTVTLVSKVLPYAMCGDEYSELSTCVVWVDEAGKTGLLLTPGPSIHQLFLTAVVTDLDGTRQVKVASTEFPDELISEAYLRWAGVNIKLKWIENHLANFWVTLSVDFQVLDPLWCPNPTQLVYVGDLPRMEELDPDDEPRRLVKVYENDNYGVTFTYTADQVDVTESWTKEGTVYGLVALKHIRPMALPDTVTDILLEEISVTHTHCGHHFYDVQVNKG